MLKVCICGPESTGKTTLARELARHYHTCYVPEYIRYFLSFQEDLYDQNNIDIIAKGQIALEAALLPYADRLLLCDTNLYHLILWCETLYNACPAWIDRMANTTGYDLYLLLDIDVPWVADNQRCLPEKRQWFLEKYIDKLTALHLPFVKIKGDWAARFKAACEIIDARISHV